MYIPNQPNEWNGMEWNGIRRLHLFSLTTAIVFYSHYFLVAHSLSSNLKPRRTPNPEDRFQTPPASPEELEEMMMNNSQRRSSKKNFRVQFGSPQAAEYQVDGPPGQLTPMPSREARERYSMKDKHVTLAEEEITQETKQNSALLAEWEEELAPSSSRRKRNHHRRQKKNRRDSSVFVPSPIILAAVALEQQYNDNDHSNEPSCASSPSVAIMENLASLRMGSSPLSKEQESPETTMESSSSSLSPDFCCPPNHNVDTVEFRVNLESVNAIGGAMDTTPPPQSAPSSQPQQHDTPQRSILPLIRSSGSRRDDSINNGSSSRSAADTTPPPANVSLDTIHSVGGALDIESPANHHSTESTSPPASMMQLCCDETQGKSPPLSTSTMTNPCLSAESSSSSSSSSPRNSFEAVVSTNFTMTLWEAHSDDNERAQNFRSSLHPHVPR